MMSRASAAILSHVMPQRSPPEEDHGVAGYWWTGGDGAWTPRLGQVRSGFAQAFSGQQPFLARRRGLGACLVGICLVCLCAGLVGFNAGSRSDGASRGSEASPSRANRKMHTAGSEAPAPRANRKMHTAGSEAPAPRAPRKAHTGASAATAGTEAAVEAQVEIADDVDGCHTAQQGEK